LTAHGGKGKKKSRERSSPTIFFLLLLLDLSKVKFEFFAFNDIAITTAYLSRSGGNAGIETTRMELFS